MMLCRECKLPILISENALKDVLEQWHTYGYVICRPCQDKMRHPAQSTPKILLSSETCYKIFASQSNLLEKFCRLIQLARKKNATTKFSNDKFLPSVKNARKKIGSCGK